MIGKNVSIEREFIRFVLKDQNYDPIKRQIRNLWF